MKSLKIHNFKLERSKSINNLKDDLLSFINNYSQNLLMKNFFSNFSKILDLEEIALKNEFNSILFREFKNKKRKFSKKLKFYYLIFSTIKFICIIIYIYIFSKKIKFFKKKDLIIDDNDNSPPEYFFKLYDLMDAIFVSNKKIKDKETFIFKDYRNCINFSQIKLGPLSILKILFYSLKYSFKSGDNLVFISLEIFKMFIRSHTIFYQLRSKFLIQIRHYNTSAIKNSIFKKYGGLKSTVIQKNILQLNGPGMFINADVIFSIGSGTCENMIQLGCNIGEIKPVGSILKEFSYYLNKNSLNETSYDLIVFASSHTADFHSGNDNYYRNYYEHFEWIRKLALKNPLIKIGIKHKNFTDDLRELKILKDIKNIKYIFHDHNIISNSYSIGYRAKSLCTWSSTLGIEMIGHGKICYFLLPNNENNGFIQIKNLDKYIVSSYESFENKILNEISNYDKKKDIHNADNYCIKSDSVSNNISKFFNAI